MFVKLEDGKEVQIGVHHTTEKVKRRGKEVEQRCTKVRVTVDGTTHEGKASCSPNDVFNRLQGRKIAGLRAVEGLSRDLKRVVFASICPEFKKTASKKRRNKNVVNVVLQQEIAAAAAI